MKLCSSVIGIRLCQAGKAILSQSHLIPVLGLVLLQDVLWCHSDTAVQPQALSTGQVLHSPALPCTAPAQLLHSSALPCTAPAQPCTAPHPALHTSCTALHRSAQPQLCPRPAHGRAGRSQSGTSGISQIGVLNSWSSQSCFLLSEHTC